MNNCPATRVERKHGPTKWINNVVTNTGIKKSVNALVLMPTITFVFTRNAMNSSERQCTMCLNWKFTNSRQRTFRVCCTRKSNKIFRPPKWYLTAGNFPKQYLEREIVSSTLLRTSGQVMFNCWLLTLHWLLAVCLSYLCTPTCLRFDIPSGL